MEDLDSSITLDAAARINHAVCQKPGQSLDLLVDPISWSEAQHSAWTSRQARWISLPLNHPDVASEQAPRLVRLDIESPRERLLGESITLSLDEVHARSEAGRKARSYCGWIVSSMSQRQLATAIAEACWQSIEGKRRLVRLWDPRLLAAWPDVSRSVSMPLGGAHGHWFFFDWRGDLRSVETTGEAPTRVSWHELRLSSLGLYNRLMQWLMPDQSGSWQIIGQRVWQCIETASQLNLSHEDDRFRVALDFFLQGNALGHSARFSDILATTHLHPGSYGAQTSEMDITDWASMVREGMTAQDSLHAQKEKG